MSNAKQQTIAGTVEDPNQKSISGVKITHPSGVSTVTDDDGRFSMTLDGNPEKDAQLVFTKAGYADKTLKVNSESVHIGFGAPIARTFNPDDYPKYDGFNLELVEDWQSSQWPNGLTWDENYKSNDAIWEPSDGGFTENLVRFQPEGIHFENDKLVLRIENKVIPNSPSWSEGQNYTDRQFSDEIGEKPLMGGEVRTRENNYRYGLYEVRMKPPGRGTEQGTATGFLATMFTFHTPRNRFWRENDIEVEGCRTDSFMTNIFYANDASAWRPEFGAPIQQNQDYQGKMPKDYDPRDWHVYAMEWLPDKLTWLVDGEPVRTFRSGDKPGIKVGAISCKIVFNFWVCIDGNAIGGDPVGNHYPIDLQYDWFRFYRWDKDGDKVTYPEE